MKITLAQPRGFCAGVTRAIEIVDRALNIYGAPIYVRHEIVHNKTVVSDLRNKGAIFIENLNDVPDGATLIFSAHGVPKSVQAQASERGFRIFDATCPLVTKVHREVQRMRENGKTIIMIGHAGHPEVEGTMGQVNDGMLLVESPEDVAKLDLSRCSKDLAFVSQTTISIDDAHSVREALKAKFPHIQEPKKSDVCYATQNRQDAVKRLAQEVDLILVIGSVTSSNSNRLREVSERAHTRAYLIDNATEMNRSWFNGVHHVGITAGASAPEFLVQEVIDQLKTWFNISEVQTLDGVQETMQFPMPKGLWQADLDAKNSS